MKSPKYSISDSLVHADWESLANALYSVDCGIEGSSPCAKKLRAQLGVVRAIMYENMVTWNGKNSIDASFLVGSYKAIKRLEGEFEVNGIGNRQLLIFLKLLLYKFEKQKLTVKKPHILIAEFGKMKGVIERVEQ